MATMPLKLPLNPSKEIYAILNKDGLYSKGGRRPRFKTTPKTWKLPHFKTHLNMFCVPGYYFNRETIGGYFTKLGYEILPEKFPYYECKILRVSVSDLYVLESTPAEEFCLDYYWDYYKRSNYYDVVVDYCTRHNIPIR